MITSVNIVNLPSWHMDRNFLGRADMTYDKLLGHSCVPRAMLLNSVQPFKGPQRSKPTIANAIAKQLSSQGGSGH